MKIFGLLVALFAVYFGQAQTKLPNNISVGKYLEVFGDDSLRVYLSCTGVIVSRKCADFYRVGKMDSVLVNFAGEITDYSVDGKPLFKGTIINNKLEGQGTYYYRNGNIKEQGSYKDDRRIGKWNYNFLNGDPQFIYIYENEEPLIWEAYTSGGKKTVTNGNGNVLTSFSGPKQCSRLEASGQVLNGRKNGRWTFGNPGAAIAATEIYENGNFIRAEGFEMDYTPRIFLTNFYPNENVELLINYQFCPGDQFIGATYNKKNLNESFYPELQAKLLEYPSPVKNQWLVVALTIDKKSHISEVNVASSIDDTDLELYIHNQINKMNLWNAMILNSTKTETILYFSVLVDNNQVIIPVDYIYKNTNLEDIR